MARMELHAEGAEAEGKASVMEKSQGKSISYGSVSRSEPEVPVWPLIQGMLSKPSSL